MEAHAELGRLRVDLPSFSRDLRVLMDEAVKRGFTGEVSMTLEDNVMVNRFIEAVGAKKYKTYRIYQKAINAAR